MIPKEKCGEKHKAEMFGGDSRMQFLVSDANACGEEECYCYLLRLGNKKYHIMIPEDTKCITIYRAAKEKQCYVENYKKLSLMIFYSSVLGPLLGQ